MNESAGYDYSLNDTVRVTVPARELAQGLGLDWCGQAGMFFDAKGCLMCFDPSVKEAVPGALLIRREILENYLNRTELALVWTVTGEKQYLTGHVREKYKGRLDISGVYQLLGSEIKGGF